MNIKKIEVVVRPHKLEAVLDAIRDLADGVTVTEVTGVSASGLGHVKYRGVEYPADNPGMMIEIVAVQADVAELIGAIVSASRTGARGDGHIFVHDVCDVVRVRNSQCGEAAL